MPVRRSFSLLATGLLAVSTSLFVVTTSAYADGGFTAAEVQDAIDAVPELTNASSNVSSTSDADSAAITDVGGVRVDIPKNAANVVAIESTAGCGDVGVQLPPAVNPQNGTLTAPGVVSFASGGNFANAVQADNLGGVRFAVVLDGPNAPEEFDYTFDLPDGSSITKEADGSVTVQTPTGTCSLAAPWAYDATGKKVYTQYLTDGYNGVSLIVNHWGEDLTYPVTADPRWVQRTWYGAYVLHFSRSETYSLARGSTLAGVITAKWWYVGASFGLAAWWAQGVYDRGQCIAAHIWPGQPWATAAWSENC